jgi:D-alanyl-D-alanine carboxypeptidase (penicillin-binding protein 5/6)
MGATSRALGALTLIIAVVLPAWPAGAVSAEDRAEPTRTVVMDPRSGSTKAPPIAADSWIVTDLDSGAVLASQDADLPVRPASTLKLLTALTVAPRLAPDQPYRGVEEDETAEGNRVVLYDGLTYKVSDLLHAALLPSANDAAEALARANGGVELTVDQMNAEAARLGATGTTARNPSGLDADGQFTTARDMALIGRAAFANPEIAEYLKLRVVDFPGKRENGKRVIYPIYNQNRMLAHSYFEGPLGGKSGYTSKAGRTLVAAAERDGRRLLVTLFRIGGNTYRAGEILLDWAFANAADLQPVAQLPEPSGPAPTFDRTIVPLPVTGQAPAPRPEVAEVADDAPTAPGDTGGWSLPSLSMPSLPSMPPVLTILTVLMGILVLLRARVYWIAHRTRAGWTELDTWAGQQARSARRPAPSGRQPAPTYRRPVDRGPVPRPGSGPASPTDGDLVGAPR